MQMIATTAINLTIVIGGISAQIAAGVKTVIAVQYGRNEFFAINATIVFRAKGGITDPAAPPVRGGSFQFNAKFALTLNFGVFHFTPKGGSIVFTLIIVRTVTTLTIAPTVIAANIVTMHFIGTIVTGVIGVTVAISAIIVTTLSNDTNVITDNIAATVTFGIMPITASFAITVMVVKIGNRVQFVTMRATGKIVSIEPKVTVGIFGAIVPFVKFVVIQTFDRIDKFGFRLNFGRSQLTGRNRLNRHNRLKPYNRAKRPLAVYVAFMAHCQALR